MSYLDLSKFFIILLFCLFIVSCNKDNPSEKGASQDLDSKKAFVSGENAKPRNRLSETSWPMFMGNISYNGNSPDRKLKPPLEILWKYKTGGHVSSSPIVVDGTVYVGSQDGNLYALNAKDWGLKWKFKAGDRILTAPTFSDGYVYFSARDNKVYALDATNGSKKWEFQADGWINAPVVAYRQKIYLGCYDKKIYVLNAINGNLDSQKLGSIRIADYDYVCSRGEFYPLDFQYQSKQWKDLIPNAESWPVKANNVVYIGARDSKIYGIDYGTRKVIWQYETGGWIDSSPAISHGVLYVGSNDGYIYAFTNANTSKPDKNYANNQGIVTQDGAKIYKNNNHQEILTFVNDGEYLSIAGQKLGEWYQVRMPNGKTGWMNQTDFMPIRLEGDFTLNADLVRGFRNLALPPKADNPSWSPDGSTVLFFDNISTKGLYWRGGSIWIISGDDSNPKWVADGAFYNPRISWSGKSDAFTIENLSGTNRQVWMARFNGTGLRKIAEGEAPSVSPDGKKVAFIRRDKDINTVWTYDLSNGISKKLLDVHVKGSQIYAAYGYLADIELPSWSPDSSLLAVGFNGYHYADNHSRLNIISSAGGLIREIGIRAEKIKDIAWSPDGKNIGFVTQEHSDRRLINRLDMKVHLVNADTKTSTEVFEHSEGISWSPKGRYLTFTEENDYMGIKKKIWLLDLKTMQRFLLLKSKDDIKKVFWISGDRIAFNAIARAEDKTARIRGWIASIQSLPE